MRRKLPKALNLAYTINVKQRQMLQRYDFMPTLQCTPYIEVKCTATIFSHCGFWLAVTDAMTTCVEEAVPRFRHQ